MSSSELQKNILATIAYYDGMDYPLTSFEVWKYLTKVESSANSADRRQSKVKSDLDEKYSLVDVISELDDYDLRKFVEEYRGFYFLRGRKELVEKRIGRDKMAVEKLKRLRRVVRLLRFIPFVRMIGVTGRLAMKHAEKESDWDVFVVLKNGKIWTGRTLVTGFLHFIGKRRHGEKIKDRICLNHFVTDESLEVITKNNFPLFSAHEFSFIFPLFDMGIFRKFQLRNNWIKDYKLNYYLNETENLKILRDSGASRIIRGIGERLSDWKFLENWLRKIERERIANNSKTHQPGSFIVAADRQLVFLPEPRGPELIHRLEEKLKLF